MDLEHNNTFGAIANSHLLDSVINFLEPEASDIKAMISSINMQKSCQRTRDWYSNDPISSLIALALISRIPGIQRLFLPRSCGFQPIEGYPWGRLYW